MDRIVRASTSPGGLVVDPFCGSGSTLVAAHRLGRGFVGLDVGELAIATSAERLAAEGAAVDVQVSSEACPPTKRRTSTRSS
jgi:site-specific DNA-methyltransferase (adenine-specific)